MTHRTFKPILYCALISLAICGCGSDVCEEAYDKQQQCIEELNCNLVGPMERPTCERTKTTFQDSQKVPPELCTGELESAAEMIINCPLNPTTCTCGS